MIIAPSLLAADFLQLESELSKINSSDAGFLHLDVMDGTFVPNISFGFPILEACAKACNKPLDVHLMTVHPERWFERLAGLGASMVSFHQEAARGATAAHIDSIHALGMKAGVVINPDVPVKRLYPYIGKADFFLIMSVFAGFGGQKFIPGSLERAALLKSFAGSSALIEMDGGIGLSNIKAVAASGVDIAVAGSSVFGAQDPAPAVAELLAEAGR